MSYLTGNYFFKHDDKWNLEKKNPPYHLSDLFYKNSCFVNGNVGFSNNPYGDVLLAGSLKSQPKVEEVGNTWDKHTNRRMMELDSRIRPLVTNFINKVEREKGVKLRISDHYRSIEDQDELYAIGRTKKKKSKKVTNAKGGTSYHNYRVAFDLVIIEADGSYKGTVISSDIAKIGTDLGFEWGGNWISFKDYPHFQMTFGQSIKDFQKKK